MTEEKLRQSIQSLPEPETDYLAVEEAFRKRHTQVPVSPKKRRRVALILCFALLLAGCVAGPTVPEYHLYNGDLGLLFPGIAFDVLCDEIGWDPELDSAEKCAEELGWTIPETLGASPRYGAEKYNLTTRDSNWFMAMLLHHYTYHSVNYGYEMETEITREDGTTSTAHWTDRDLELYFGSMENEVWRRQFGFDENDVWAAQETNFQGLENNYPVEYEGETLYVATFRYNSDFYGLISLYGQYVSWVDYDRNTVFSLYARDDTPDFAISCAKELIDHLH